MAASIDKARIIVVGDSGVGKTSLVHLIAHNEALINPGWTIGCSVEVKLHEYKEGSSSQQSYFIELFDIGGSISHQNTRGVFYNPTHGIILVHDLTNSKSHDNLQRWLYEIMNKDGKDASRLTSCDSDFDPEVFLGSTQIPILVIGTKADLVDDVQRMKQSSRSGNIAEQCGADVICLNCHEIRSLATGSPDASKLSRFFDKVIERKYFQRGSENYAADRRKYATQFSGPAPPVYASTTIAAFHADPKYSTANGVI